MGRPIKMAAGLAILASSYLQGAQVMKCTQTIPGVVLSTASTGSRNLSYMGQAADYFVLVNAHPISADIPPAAQIRSYLLGSGSHQSLAGESVHEPFSEVLASHWKERGVSSSGGELRG